MMRRGILPPSEVSEDCAGAAEPAEAEARRRPRKETRASLLRTFLPKKYLPLQKGSAGKIREVLLERTGTRYNGSDVTGSLGAEGRGCGRKKIIAF